MREVLKDANVVVIKAGTTVVSTPDGSPSLVRLSGIVEQVGALMAAKKRVVLVTSGAVGCGRSRLRKQMALNHSFRDLRKMPQLFETARTKTYDSACAAAGQLTLMSLYETLFSTREIEASQFLVTQRDFEDSERQKNLKYAMTEILDVGMIPIINENDAVSGNLGYELPEDSSFSDNDGLAALVAKLIGADVLVLLSDVDGLYDRPPKKPGATLIDWCSPEDRKNFQFGEKSVSGRGGMEAKVAAAFRAVEAGIPCVALASGAEPGVVERLLVKGEKVGTLFTSDLTKRAKRSVTEDVLDQLRRTRDAQRTLHSLNGEQRSEILRTIASLLLQDSEAILKANEIDVASAEVDGVDTALRQRLGLSLNKLKTLSEGAMSIAESTDPIHSVQEKRELAPGLVLERRACGLGVILVIFEARPEALIQISLLAIRAGCGLVLKGGSEAKYSNQALHNLVVKAVATVLKKDDLASDLVVLLRDRAAVGRVLSHPDCAEYVDLAVPRGSNALVRHVQQSTKIPVLGHADGVCHVFLDSKADLAKAQQVLIDAKTDYPAACNAAETVLIHAAWVEGTPEKTNTLIQQVLLPLHRAGVVLHPGPRLAALKIGVQDLFSTPASAMNVEYGSLAVAVETVADVDDAVRHVNANGSHHTDCVLTEDLAVAQKFLKDVDSACVFHNASTRFADGFRFGLGAELGIATGRIHARGPVGVKGFLTYKWCLASDDFHTQQHFATGAKAYTFKDLPLTNGAL